MAIQVEKKEIITVTDDNGAPLAKGDPVLIRFQGQDVVCRFMGMRNGYFSTETLDDKAENKYRPGSIESCRRISGIREWPVPVAAAEREE